MSRRGEQWLRRRPALALALAVVMVMALPGCGRASPAERALRWTTDNLSEVRSGDLVMKLLSSAADAPAGQGVGFELFGPFAVAEEKGRLPVVSLDYTQVTGAERSPTKFISTGTNAYLQRGDTIYHLAPEQVRDLRATGDEAGDGALADLDLDDWARGPTIEPAGSAKGINGTGAGADRITGPVDAVEALNDILALARGLGASTEGAPLRLEGEDAEQVRRAVRGATMELVTGRKDRLLRQLRVEINLEPGPGSAQALAQALGPLAGARITLELGLTQPNREVIVAEPEGARPASELGG